MWKYADHARFNAGIVSHQSIHSDIGLARCVVTNDAVTRENAAPVYLYELDWQTPVDGGKWHSPHSLDLAFVFDNVAKSASMVGTGPEPQKLADEMSNAWLAFARTGNPLTAD